MITVLELVPGVLQHWDFTVRMRASDVGTMRSIRAAYVRHASAHLLDLHVQFWRRLAPNHPLPALRLAQSTYGSGGMAALASELQAPATKLGEGPWVRLASPIAMDNVQPVIQIKTRDRLAAETARRAIGNGMEDVMRRCFNDLSQALYPHHRPNHEVGFGTARRILEHVGAKIEDLRVHVVSHERRRVFAHSFTDPTRAIEAGLASTDNALTELRDRGERMAPNVTATETFAVDGIRPRDDKRRVLRAILQARGERVAPHFRLRARV